MDTHPRPVMTPLVGRLAFLNATVYLLFATILTAPVFLSSLALTASAIPEHPWTILTFPFLHVSLPHLAITSLGLLVFGPSLERQLGSSRLLGYLAGTSLGVAVAALALVPVGVTGPVTGPWGSVLALAWAYGVFHADEEVPVFALPLTIRLRALVWFLLAVATTAALVNRPGGFFHLADLGGVLAGSLFLRLRSPRGAALPRAEVPDPRTAALTPIRLAAATESEPEPIGGGVPPSSAPRGDGPAPPAAEDEINRVLDKISAEGMESLTPQERRFLQYIAQQKRDRSRPPA